MPDPRRIGLQSGDPQMLTQRRNALALAAVLAVTTVTGGALVTVLSSHPAARQPSIHPAVITVPQVAAPLPAAAHLVSAHGEPHEQEGGDS
jgi:hypothetical protein